VLTAFLSKWPLVRQIRERKGRNRPRAMSEKTRRDAMRALNDAEVARSICPYCGVGAVIDFPQGRQTVSIEGDPNRQLARGTFAPRAWRHINC